MLGMLHRMLHYNPKLGVAERTGLLVVAAGPYFPYLRREVTRTPVGALAVALAASAANGALSTGPVLAVERAADAWADGDRTSPDHLRRRQHLLLAGGAAGVVTGVLAQGVLLRVTGHGIPSQAARALAGDLAIGSAATVLVVGSDVALGARGRATLSNTVPGVTIGSLIAAGQAVALRRIAPHLSVETPNRPRRVRALRRPR
ncbi:MAG TPA: hypothetical protein VF143_05475 [Candidatus Nanopelagicales bacterium]